MKNDKLSVKKLAMKLGVAMAIILMVVGLSYVFILPMFYGSSEEVDFSEATIITENEINVASPLDMMNADMEAIEERIPEEEGESDE